MDNFRFVFNEQILDDGAGLITVNAAHQYLLGPSATGDLIIGQVVCSTTSAVVTTTTSTTTTAPPATTTTTLSPTVTTAPPGRGTGGGQSPLARTGGSSRLLVTAASAFVLGALLLRGDRRQVPWNRRGRR